MLGAAEAAAELGVAAETLRYWERAGLLQPVGRDAGRLRRYSPSDLEYLDVIRCLRLTGLPVRTVRRFSELVRRGPKTAPDRLAMLQAHHEAVTASIAAQQVALAVIDAKIPTYKEMTA